MRINFNMGQMGDTTAIENICKAHQQCEGCPVMEKGAIQDVLNRKTYSC